MLLSLGAGKGAKSRVALVPVEGASLLDVASVPVESVAIVVGVAAGDVPVHGGGGGGGSGGGGGGWFCL